MPLSSIEAVGRIGVASPRRVGSAPVAESASFADFLGKALETAEEKGREANVAVVGMLDKTVDVHEAMIALHEAEEAVEITVAIRNKFVKAYQEIMGMGI